MKNSNNKIDKHHAVIMGLLKAKPLVMPRKAVIELANGCNLKCDFCWSHSPLLKNQPNAEWNAYVLAKEKIFAYVDELAEIKNFEYVELCAVGDPMYHPDIWEIVDYIKMKKLTLRISTNGTLISPEKMERFLEIGVDQLNINLSASTREEYSSIHNVSPKIFDNLWRNLIHLRDRKQAHGSALPYTRLVNVITPKNISSILRLLEIGEILGANNILFRKVWNHKEFLRQIVYPTEVLKEVLGNKNIILNYANSFKFTHDLEIFYSEMESLFNHQSQQSLQKSEQNIELRHPPCTVAYHFSVLGVNGVLRSCCHSDREMEPYKNLKEQWYGEKYQNFRKTWRERYVKNLPLCEGCAHADEHHRYAKKLKEAKIEIN